MNRSAILARLAGGIKLARTGAKLSALHFRDFDRLVSDAQPLRRRPILWRQKMKTAKSN